MEQELKKLQKIQSADQKKWRNEKGVLVREISGLRAKKVRLETISGELDTQLETKKLALGNLSVEYDAITASLETLDTQQTDKQAILVALDKKTEQKKAEIDSGLSNYRETREAEIESELSVKTEALDKLNKDIEEAQTELKMAQDSTSELQTSHQVAKDQNAQELADFDSSMAGKRSEAETLGKTIEELQILQDELEAELKKLKFDRDQAISDTNKARIEHEQFIKYEQKARDALNAKDKSLQIREDAVEQDSVMMRNARSNLPQL